MSNGSGDSSYGVVTNVKASVLPYRDWNRVPRDERMAQARRAIALMAVGCYTHMGLGMSEGVAVQRGVDIGPQVIDLC